eukprot:UN25253
MFLYKTCEEGAPKEGYNYDLFERIDKVEYTDRPPARSLPFEHKIREASECENICVNLKDYVPDIFERKWTHDDYLELKTWAMQYLDTPRSREGKCYIPFITLIMWQYETSISKMFEPALCKMIQTFEMNEPNSIFFPKSTWNTGRNLLLFLALKIEDELDLFFDYFGMADGDIDEIKVCTKTDERWVGPMYLPGVKEYLGITPVSPKFEPTHHHWKQCLAVTNPFSDDNGIIHGCSQQSVKVCEWLCDCWDDCTAWNSYEVKLNDNRCYMFKGDPDTELAIIKEKGSAWVRNSDHCDMTNNWYDQIEKPILENRPAIAIPGHQGSYLSEITIRNQFDSMVNFFNVLLYHFYYHMILNGMRTHGLYQQLEYGIMLTFMQEIQPYF